MQARISLSELADGRPLVNPALVPQQDDVSGQMAQKRPQKPGHVGGLEVILLEPDVQPHAASARRDAERRQRRDAIVFVAVADDGRLSPQSPCPTACGDEQKPALIQEHQMGAKPSGLFLYAASGSASNALWLARRAGWPGVREPGNSTRRRAAASRRGWGGTGLQTAAGLPARCASASRSRWESRRPPPRPAGFSTGVAAAWPAACRADRVLVWEPRPSPRRADGRPTIATQRKSRPAPAGQLRSSSPRPPTEQPHAAAAAPSPSPFRMVSCLIYRRFPSFTLAKLNSSLRGQGRFFRRSWRRRSSFPLLLRTEFTRLWRGLWTAFHCASEPPAALWNVRNACVPLAPPRPSS